MIPLDRVLYKWYVTYAMILKSRIRIIGPHWKNDNESPRIAQAKKYPIEKLYAGKLRRVGRVMMGVCPFHEERSASFAIYPEDNHWHCFAESIGGDSISFYMQLTGCNFVQAIEELGEKT